MNRVKILRFLWFVLPLIVMLLVCAVSYFLLLSGYGLGIGTLRL